MLRGEVQSGALELLPVKCCHWHGRFWLCAVGCLTGIHPQKVWLRAEGNMFGRLRVKMDAAATSPIVVMEVNSIAPMVSSKYQK